MKPAFGGFFFDDADHLWVAAVRPAGEPSGFDVFDPAGRFLGVVAIAEEANRVRRPLVLGDRLYAVAGDELNIPYVVRHRIVGRGAPTE